MVKRWFRLSKNLKTFGDLSDAFLRAVESNSKQNECHVLFDHYNKASINSGTRLKRNHSTVPIEHEISNRETILPKNSDLSIHLCELMSEEIAKEALKLDDNYKQLTSGGFAEFETVGTSISRNIEHLLSNHEGADVHEIDCSLTRIGRLIVHNRDTDVLLFTSIKSYQDEISNI
ncbi:hypothetical protein JTB14_024435 [Gonioctena quinquepunctata]|nr:hypothetical protein JTB14_024435 [Gonioctena quinquepunctata]